MKIYRFTVAMALLLLNALPSLAQTEGHQIETNADHAVAAIQDTETTAQRDARMDWWRKARFGMFIHWGLYSIPAGTWNNRPVPSIGEWIMNNASIPVADYKELARGFNPQGFNAHDIVALAKASGVDIELPGPATDPIATVLVLETNAALTTPTRVVFIADPEGGFKAELSDDGVHPNRDGYAAARVLASNLWRSIRALIFFQHRQFRAGRIQMNGLSKMENVIHA